MGFSGGVGHRVDTVARSGVFGIMAVALIYPLTHWPTANVSLRTFLGE